MHVFCSDFSGFSPSPPMLQKLSQLKFQPFCDGYSTAHIDSSGDELSLYRGRCRFGIRICSKVSNQHQYIPALCFDAFSLPLSMPTLFSIKIHSFVLTRFQMLVPILYTPPLFPPAMTHSAAFPHSPQRARTPWDLRGSTATGLSQTIHCI